MPAWFQNIILVPFSPLLTLMSNEDGAQTSHHCLLGDDVPNHAGAFDSQNSILYSSKKHRAGGLANGLAQPERARRSTGQEAL